MKTVTKLWIGIGVLILLSPLGILLPERFEAGDAWGEWGAENFTGMLGYIPRGLEKLSGLWNAPMPDYAFSGWEDKGLAGISLAYIASAAIGILITVGIMLLITRLLGKKK